MQITDINDFISTAAQLLNAPDLILIAVQVGTAFFSANGKAAVNQRLVIFYSFHSYL